MTSASERYKPSRNQSGFSLIEIMVALVIGLLLILGITQVYLSSKASYRTNDGLAQIQETGRFLTQMLNRSIRMTGYRGCRQFDSSASIISNESTAIEDFLDQATVIDGANDVTTGNSYNAKSGSDVIELSYFAPVPASLTTDISRSDTGAASKQVKIDDNPTNIAPDDILFMTNCEQADIFTATAVSASSSPTTITHDTGGNTPAQLNANYATGNSELLEFRRHRYYIATASPSSQNASGDTIYTLYRQELDINGNDKGNPTPIADGVEALEIAYGVDTNGDGDVDQYRTANNVTDFANVLTVRVATLVNSVDPSLPEADTATYTLAGVTYDPPDNRLLRKPFDFTASIRNRTLPRED